jgi:subtilisin
VIVTFKKKDQRKQKSLDKREILTRHVKSRLEFCDVVTMQDLGAVPRVPGEAELTLDLNSYELPVLAGRFSPAEIKALEGDPDVELVEEDALAHATAVPVRARETGPALEPWQTAPVIAEDAPSVASETLPWGVNRIDAERAWEVTRAAGIRVAVIDTGIDPRHVDLVQNFAGGVSFVSGEDFTDGNGHGTHVAGTIGARQNGAGVIGVAPNCRLYSVKVLSRTGSGSYSAIISGILWCVRNGIDVINMSLGGSAHVQALQNACDYAFANNVVVVAAAGNSGPGADSVGYPGRYDSVICVSNVDATDTIAPSSSRGSQVDLAAPGTQILSTLPGNRYGRLTGTSMASPHVAGAAALTLSSHRYTPAETIRKILLETADNLGTPGRDDLYGHGLVDAEQAAFARGP